MDVNAMAFGVMCLCLPRAETHGRCSVVCRAGASFSSPSPPRASSQRTYFATCARGLGELLAKEIEDNVTDRIVAVKGSGVAFEGDASVGYRAAMNLRTATRVLERLAKSIVDPYDVHRAARDMVPWERYIASDQTFTVNVRDWRKHIQFLQAGPRNVSSSTEKGDFVSPFYAPSNLLTPHCTSVFKKKNKHCR